MKVSFVFAVLYIYLCLFPIALYADDYYIQWADTIDNGAWDGASSIAVDNSNNIVVVGCSFIGGNNDYFVVKYDSSGTILWQDTIDNGGEDNAEAVAVDYSNNIIMTGYSMIGGDYDYFTVKYDSNGTILWQDTLDNHGLYDIARGVAVDNANNIAVTGYCDIGSDCVYFTVKYDSSGTIIWADTLDNGPFDSAFDVAVDNAHNIIVTGYTSTGTDNDYFTVKYDSSGTILWQETIDIYEFDQAYGVAGDNSKNIIVTGCSGGPFDDYDWFTVKYDSNGTIIWADTLDNNSSDDVSYGVTVDDYNNIYVTGYSLELSGNYDYFTVKYDSNGTILWQDTLNNGNDDIAYAIAVDDLNNIIMTGRSYLEGNFDYFTVKYAPVPGIFNRNKPDNISGVIQCVMYPNPFGEKTEIKLMINDETMNNGRVDLKIYDSSGRLVKNLSPLIANSHLPFSITWDGTGIHGKKLPVGVYFLKLNAGEYTASRKLLMVR